ncbi:MAG: 2-amino-4-hydroxy-6-hydroxymethyldihydropteridine diphosphokinase [Hyphomicrobiales bacterium]|nr:2-amino-4-hydroxy-6-hydroxymethyldihydropteridine diphosphokinase [Hyphomicrobiales bacterium]
MADAAIALGSNVGDAAGNLDRAVAAIAASPEIRIDAVSPYYRTAPWGVTDQDWFVNACIAVDTTLSPRDLLARCLEIETEMGRVRDRRWGPRLIDLDLLYYGDLAIDEPGLVVPHPHLFDRAFVLRPLADIRPDRIVQGRRIADALTGLDLSDIVPVTTLGMALAEAGE